MPSLAAASDSARVREDRAIYRAVRILEKRLRAPGQRFMAGAEAERFFILRLSSLEHEVFEVLFLDNQYQMIAVETMFRGTINEAACYPREVVKAALRHNAATVIVAHNHPSGNIKPSSGDRYITRRLRTALALVDVHLLDHILIAGTHAAHIKA